ncbi:acid phosphatase det1 [Chytriomyces hyalinus]|nr:acid phosphatase det1 [Chytriomyces hyalinus]
MIRQLLKRESAASPAYEPLRIAAATANSLKISRCIEMPTSISQVLRFDKEGNMVLCLGHGNKSVMAFALEKGVFNEGLSEAPSFSSFFRDSPLFDTTITHGHETLVRDFCLLINLTPSQTSSRRRSFVLLASACPSLDGSSPSNSSNATYPHALNHTVNDVISLWLVCLESGMISDKLVFPCDHIVLSHAAGVQVNGDILAVTSVKNQTIHLFHIQESGTFVKQVEVGWHTRDDDEFCLAKARSAQELFDAQQQTVRATTSLPNLSNFSSFMSASLYRNRTLLGGNDRAASNDLPYVGPAAAPGGPIRPVELRRSLRRSARSAILPRVSVQPNASVANIFSNPNNHHGADEVVHVPSFGGRDGVNASASNIPNALPFSGLKQRLLSFLYRKAAESGNPATMRHFYLTFDQYASLVMWRMQFLENDTILIKFGGIENALGRPAEPLASQATFFMEYSLETTQVLNVYDNTSHELLERFCSEPQFRGSAGNHGLNYVTNATNNDAARDFVKKQLYSVGKAKNGGRAQSVKRILASLPLNPQYYIESPLLDQRIFSYDESMMNNVQRPRSWSSQFAVKFWDRETGQVRFKIDPNPGEPGSAIEQALTKSKKYVSYIFHPWIPFVISVMTVAGRPPIYNFHFVCTE